MQAAKKKKLIRGTIYLPNCHDSQCSEAYAVWHSVPVHCAPNERERHQIMCIIHTLSSVITKTLSPSKPRNDDKDGLSFTVRASAFLKK